VNLYLLIFKKTAKIIKKKKKKIINKIFIMGQKTNKQTLYKNRLTKNFYPDYLFGKQYIILNTLKRLLLIKGGLVIKCNITLTVNKFILLYYFYVFSRKISFYKRLGSSTINTKPNLKLMLFEKILKNCFKFLRINSLIIQLCCLNSKVDKLQILYIYKLFKKYINILFVKNFNLFIDFLKIIVLFNNMQIEIESFIYIISVIFKKLHKRLHNKYFVFLNTLIKFLLKNKYSCSIVGIKLKISGKLKGKPIASNHVYLKGKISTQSFSTNIRYSQKDIFTKYGVFGLKFWIRYK